MFAYFVRRKEIFYAVVETEINHIEYTISSDCCGQAFIQAAQSESVFFYDFPSYIKRWWRFRWPNSQRYV